MKLIPIKEVRIPGSNVILEAGDKLYYEEESITDLLSNRGFSWSHQDRVSDTYVKLIGKDDYVSVEVGYKNNKVKVFRTSSTDVKIYTKIQFKKNFDSIMNEFGV